MLRRMALASLVLFVCTSVLVAQDPPRRRGGAGGQPGMGMGQQGPMSLLGIEDVKKELKLDEEQIKKIEEVNKKIRDLNSGLRDLPREEQQQKRQENMTKAAEMSKEALAVLKPEQSKRLKQLQYQRDGVMVLATSEDARKELNLTQEQADKIKAISDDQRTQMREMFQGGGGGGGDRQEAQKKMEELRKTTQTKLEGVLTDEQKTKWKEMLGEPFKGNLRPQMRRPGTIG
jgi:Spy/CpxP family protein refolding chaperone